MHLSFRLESLLNELLSLLVISNELVISHLVRELREAFDWCLQESFCSAVVLLDESCELGTQVEHVVWINLGSSVHLTMPVDVVAVQELLVKHYNQFLFCLANYSASGSEGNELSQS